MKESSDGFVRADQIDLKSLDEQLERHLNKVLTLDKTKMRAGGDQDTTNSAANNLNSLNLSTTTAAASAATSTSGMTLSIPKRHRQEWEIDPSKLIIKSVIARGTFGTVHRGIYDGQDVADLMCKVDFDAVTLVCAVQCWIRTDAEIASLRAAFTQEVAVWHKLDHPNVTKFIGATMGSSELQIQTENGQIGMPSNICCVVVEYLPGGALKSYLIKNRRRKLAFKVVVQLALDLARG
ncbi:hypothetical protein ACLB2K_048980 [Fragaria x ananassa]